MGRKKGNHTPTTDENLRLLLNCPLTTGDDKKTKKRRELVPAIEGWWLPSDIVARAKIGVNHIPRLREQLVNSGFAEDRPVFPGDTKNFREKMRAVRLKRDINTFKRTLIEFLKSGNFRYFSGTDYYRTNINALILSHDFFKALISFELLSDFSSLTMTSLEELYNQEGKGGSFSSFRASMEKSNIVMERDVFSTTEEVLIYSLPNLYLAFLEKKNNEFEEDLHSLTKELIKIFPSLTEARVFLKTVGSWEQYIANTSEARGLMLKYNYSELRRICWWKQNTEYDEDMNQAKKEARKKITTKEVIGKRKKAGGSYTGGNQAPSEI